MAAKRAGTAERPGTRAANSARTSKDNGDNGNCPNFQTCAPDNCDGTCGAWVQRGSEDFYAEPAGNNAAKFETTVRAWGPATGINFQIYDPSPPDVAIDPITVQFKTSLPSLSMLNVLQRFGYWYLPPGYIDPLKDGKGKGAAASGYPYCGKFTHAKGIGPIPGVYCDDPFSLFRCPLEWGENLSGGQSVRIEGLITGFGTATVSGRVLLAGR